MTATTAAGSDPGILREGATEGSNPRIHADPMATVVSLTQGNLPNPNLPDSMLTTSNSPGGNPEASHVQALAATGATSHTDEPSSSPSKTLLWDRAVSEFWAKRRSKYNNLGSSTGKLEFERLGLDDGGKWFENSILNKKPMKAFEDDPTCTNHAAVAKAEENVASSWSSQKSGYELITARSTPACSLCCYGSVLRG